jgi:RNA recognition motif-containing protein
MNIYVGNLSHSASEADLRAAFEAFGEVSRANIVTDRDTGQPRGFGFVEMPNQAEAQAAMNGLNGQEMMGRTLTVNEARPKTDSRGGGGGGHRGGSGGGGGRDRRGGGGGGYNRSW